MFATGTTATGHTNSRCLLSGSVFSYRKGGAVLSRFAIEFGDVPESPDVTRRVTPLFIPSTNRLNDRWEFDKGDIGGNLSGYITVPPNERVQRPVILPQSGHFALSFFRTTAYYINARPGGPLSGTVSIPAGGYTMTGVLTAFTTELVPGDHLEIAGVPYRVRGITNNTSVILKDAPVIGIVAAPVAVLAREWYEWYETDFSEPWFFEQGDDKSRIGTPYTRYLAVSLYTGSDRRFLLGDREPNPGNPNPTDPLHIATIQGNDSGYGQVYTPYLFPKGGTIDLDIHNLHPTKYLKVNVTLCGTKVVI